jgi:transketolase
MALSRQDLPVLDAVKYNTLEGTRKGAYVLEAFGTDVIIVGTGSEVAMAMQAAETLKGEGILATVISMPSFKLLEEQGEDYIMELFPHGVPKIAIEAGATMGWWKYVGRDGIVIGLDRFGASAPAPLVQNKLGICADAVVEAAKKLVRK